MKRGDTISRGSESRAGSALGEPTLAPVTVLVAEPQPILREALMVLLSGQDGMAVLGGCCDGAEAVAMANEARPDVVVLAALPGSDPFTATAEIHRWTPSCRVLVLLSSGRPGHVRRAMEAGAAGLLLMDASLPELTAAIRRVAGGERYLDTELAAAALSAGVNPLSEREREVLAMAADGAAVDTVAGALFISPGTARNHLSSAIRKLGARNRVEAARMADGMGWL